jgi:hypothetical protein
MHHRVGGVRLAASIHLSTSLMSIPETTSDEGFERYVGGECLFRLRGDAWRDLKAWIVALPTEGHTLPLPSVSEPFLAWTRETFPSAIALLA